MDILQPLIDAINEQTDENLVAHENPIDWFELFSGTTMITEGDIEHVQRRLKGIARENGVVL